MAHERRMVPRQPLPVHEERPDQRWPVPYAIMFVVVVSAGLWSLIIALSSRLIG